MVAGSFSFSADTSMVAPEKKFVKALELPMTVAVVKLEPEMSDMMLPMTLNLAVDFKAQFLYDELVPLNDTLSPATTGMGALLVMFVHSPPFFEYCAVLLPSDHVTFPLPSDSTVNGVPRSFSSSVLL